MASSAASAAPARAVPPMVRQFAQFMRKHVRGRNVHEAQRLYDHTMIKITEKFYRSSKWPSAEEMEKSAPLAGEEEEEEGSCFGGDELFKLLYKQLYFRHLYVHTANPSLAERVASWDNYCALFDALLANEDPRLELELPFHWTWDLIDEFLYQYEAFSAYRAKLTYKTAAELRALDALTKEKRAWETDQVKSYLARLVEKSQILPLLEKRKAYQARYQNGARDAEDLTTATAGGDLPFADHPLYRMLGDFAIVGQVRLHVILGEFTQALEAAGPLELNNKKALHTIVPASYFNLYYHLAIAFIMLSRFADATKVLSHILLFEVRTRNVLRSLRGGTSYHQDIIAKKTEQMYALLAICVALWPTRVEDALHQNLRDKFGDKTSRLQRSEVSLREYVEELWRTSGPKFIQADATWDYQAAAAELEEKKLHTGREGESPLIKNFAAEFSASQKDALLKEAGEQQFFVTIRSYLKLYTSVSVKKVAGFLKMSEEDLRQQLARFKEKVTGVQWVPGGLPIGEKGKSSPPLDANFELKGDMIVVGDSRREPRYTDLFVRHLVKFHELENELDAPTERTPEGIAA